MQSGNLLNRRQTFKVALLSTSPIKLAAVRSVLERSDELLPWVLTAHQIDDVSGNQIEQPIDQGGELAAKNRLDWARNRWPDLIPNHDLVIVIENYMVSQTGEDRICIIFYDCRRDKMLVRDYFCAQAQDLTLFNSMLEQYRTHRWGCTVTYGQLLHQQNSEIPANDWMSAVVPKPRQQALEEALAEISKEYQATLETK